jgi:hypothetical protein
VTETISGKKETSSGMTGREFTDRWQEHKYDVKHKSSKKPTQLSSHTWTLKDQSKDFNIDWDWETTYTTRLTKNVCYF